MMKYEIKAFPIECADGTFEWGAEFPAVKGCVGGGLTCEEAVNDACNNLEQYLEILKENGMQIPAEYSEYRYSGRISLRMSKSLHRRAAEIAEQEGISLNSFLEEAIAVQCGTKTALSTKNNSNYTFNLSQQNNFIRIDGGTRYVRSI